MRGFPARGKGMNKERKRNGEVIALQSNLQKEMLKD